MSLNKKTASVILTIIMLFSFCACSKSTGKIVKFENGKQVTVSPKYAGKKYHVTNPNKLELVSKSGLVEMYIDKQTYSTVIKETSLENVWYSLPLNEDKVSSILNVNVTKDDILYKLNSQDNSVAFGKVNFKKKDNGIWVTYTLCDKAKNPNVSVPITVRYTLTDGSLYVDVRLSKIADNKEYKIENIELLKYFGATDNNSSGDFILAPDGCGAKINTSIKTKDKNFEYKIYNQDYSASDKKIANSVVPAFGVKTGKGAFGAIIRKGDSLATVCVTKAKNGKYNLAYPNFNITPTKIIDGRRGKKKYIAKQSFNGEISVCYRFLSGKSATYSGIAAVCREQLIRDAVLSTKVVKETDTCPVNVTFIGAKKGGTFFGDNETTFEEALSMTELLKAKGVDDCNILYSAALTRGLGQANIKDSTLIGKLGSKKELNEFLEYATTQEFGVYLDTNILAMKGGSCARDINGKKSRAGIKNPLFSYFEPKDYSRYLVKLENLEDNVNNFLTDMREVPFSGYCVSDAGAIIYSDFSSDLVTREETKNIIANQVISMSTNKKTMTKTGNFYMLKNIDVVHDIPMSTSYKENNYYDSIPFIQMILHGMIEYSGAPVNLQESYKDSVLKSIEYGALLSYDLTFDDFADKKGKNSLCYENWMSKITEGYNTYNIIFSDIRDSKISNHYEPVKDLTCTLFDNGSYIYVNHSNKDITYNNLVIKAKNYLRVN